MFEAAAAVAALTEDPAPPESFPYGTERRRLRAGDYRIMYRVDGDVITVVHVARRI
jgi:mRNA-degrading endonuclease RelE of RelBE toxin-antitoxin system